MKKKIFAINVLLTVGCMVFSAVTTIKNIELSRQSKKYWDTQFTQYQLMDSLHTIVIKQKEIHLLQYADRLAQIEKGIREEKEALEQEKEEWYKKKTGYGYKN